MVGTSHKQHHRSISHPFPGLFGWKKSSRTGSAAGPGLKAKAEQLLSRGLDSIAIQVDSSDDDDDDDEIETDPARPSIHSSRRQRRRSENRTANCQTCDTKVQWPSHMSSFRCTECLMINDTVPRSASTSRSREAEGAKNYTDLSLSVEHIRKTIHNCIISYLRQRLHPNTNTQDKPGNPPTLSRPDFEKIRISGPPPKDPPNQASPTKQPLPTIRLQNLPPRKPVVHTTELPTPSDRPSPHDRRPERPAPFISNALRSNSNSPRTETAAPFLLLPDPATVRTQIRSLSTSNSSPPKFLHHKGFANRLDMHHTSLREGRRLTPSHSSKESDSNGSPRLANRSPVRPTEEPKRIFTPLEEYILHHFGQWEALNSSFYIGRGRPLQKSPAENTPVQAHTPLTQTRSRTPVRPPGEGSTSTGPTLDPRMLLIGNIVENGSWWASNQEPVLKYNGQKSWDEPFRFLATSRSPLLNWNEMMAWYDGVLSAGRRWMDVAREHVPETFPPQITEAQRQAIISEIESEIGAARISVHRALLKATENVLKRPGRPVREHYCARFLLILLANPLLNPALARRYIDVRTGTSLDPAASERSLQPQGKIPRIQLPQQPSSQMITSGNAHQRSRSSDESSPSVAPAPLVKRILGLISNLPPSCHRVFVTWITRFPEEWLYRLVDMVATFVNLRLSSLTSRKFGARSRAQADPTAGLIPRVNNSTGMSSIVQLHAALGLRNIVGTGLSSHSSSNASQERRKEPDVVFNSQPPPYSDDWQLRSAACVMALLFSANNNYYSQRVKSVFQPANSRPNSKKAASPCIQAPGQLIPTSYFYNQILDTSGYLIQDFDSWESRRYMSSAFSFCKYPFFLSLGAKIRILQYDCRRQMEDKYREAFFESLNRRNCAQSKFNMSVRRNCLAADSLSQISQGVASGTGADEVKKGLRVQFVGEEGVDAGGLRKEWFLLVVRELFDPRYGMFLYDEESKYCYFNPFTFEQGEQYYLVGAIIGLAIYNSTILDIQLPPFAFRKLMAAAPPRPSQNGDRNGRSQTGLVYNNQSQFSPTLDDLEQLNPVVARSLRQLLEYDPGNVEDSKMDPIVDVFGLTFSIPVDFYGQSRTVELVPNGENIDVTLSNRQEFVNLYVRYLLVESVQSQFDPFKRGFWSICAGNAIDLFQAEEVELLVRGADEPLDVQWLKVNAVHEGFYNRKGAPLSSEEALEQVPAIRWFWEMLSKLSDADSRRVVGWITGSDRLPAVGTASLVIKVVCAGEVGMPDRTGREIVRLPVARTCFNMIQLPVYRTREELEEKVWCAVSEGGGFSMK